MLVDLKIKNLKSKAHTYYVADEGICPGLVVRVTPKEHKAFVLRMKINGKRKTKIIGTYGQISLSEARKEGLRLRGQISLGEDVFNKEPANDSEPQKQATVEELSKAYVQQLDDRKARNAQDIRRILKKDVLPAIGDKIANEITPYDIGAVLKPVIKRGSVGQAKKIRSYIHSMFNVGMALGNMAYQNHNWSESIKAFSTASSPSRSQAGTISLMRCMPMAVTPRHKPHFNMA